MEEEELGIESKRLREIISRVLSEFDLELKSIEEIEGKKGDLLAICSDKLEEKVTSLIRISTDIEGVERFDVEDLYEDMLQGKSRTAVFITTSYFFKETKEFAEELPVKLIDKIKLSEIIAEIEAIKRERAFVSDMSDRDVVNYFQRRIRGVTWGKLGLMIPETIAGIDRRYAPVGAFILKRVEDTMEDRRPVYIDLSSGDILYIDEGAIKKDGFMKNILNLPKKSREHLMDLVEHGELHHEHIEGKHLTILEKKGLVSKYEKKSGGLLGSILKEIMTAFIEIISQVGELVTTSTTRPIPPPGAAPPVKKRVMAHINIPLFDQPYNLGRFMEVSKASEGFDPDPKIYEPEEIEEILNRTTNYEVKFEYMVYFPYYLGKYSSRKGERYMRLYSAKFKEFFPRPSSYGLLHHIINKYPELFYILVAVLYIGYSINEIEGIKQVFSAALIFMVICGITGTLLKAAFKTEREVPYYGVSIFRYGFPSLHSLLSIGLIGFVYFIDPIGPVFSLALIPVGLIYGYSRIRIRAHTLADVVGGGIIGLIIGILSGMYLLSIDFPEPVGTILAALFILTPFISIIVRIKYIR
ncbi:MAG: phosphatase PAP2 family protein [Candidatus Altiarchaeota archaeon]|nr:phosphatase PAP2 family protein [Candidatus Altiarchaeota archaeon]